MVGGEARTRYDLHADPCEPVSSSTTFELLDQQFCKLRAPLIVVIVRDAYKVSQVSRRPLEWLKMRTWMHWQWRKRQRQS